MPRKAERGAVLLYGEHSNAARRPYPPLYDSFFAFSKASSMVPTM